MAPGITESAEPEIWAYICPFDARSEWWEDAYLDWWAWHLHWYTDPLWENRNTSLWEHKKRHSGQITKTQHIGETKTSLFGGKRHFWGNIQRHVFVLEKNKRHAGGKHVMFVEKTQCWGKHVICDGETRHSGKTKNVMLGNTQHF